MNLNNRILFEQHSKCHCDILVMAYNSISTSRHDDGAQWFNQVNSITACFLAIPPFTISCAVTFIWLFAISAKPVTFTDWHSLGAGFPLCGTLSRVSIQDSLLKFSLGNLLLINLLKIKINLWFWFFSLYVLAALVLENDRFTLFSQCLMEI